MKIGILFGSSSNEHEVSVVSASSIIKNIDKERYEVVPIYLDKKNSFYIWNKDIYEIDIMPFGQLPDKLEKIDKPFEFLKTFDLIFIMIHGKNGEDGILSSILEFLNVPYVGNNTASCVVTMDKILTKEILENNKIKTSPYIYFIKYNNEFIYKDKVLTKKEILDIINDKLRFPLFVKPANSGSSLGITKVKVFEELNDAINCALEVDHRILIESEVKGREIECGVLEYNGELITSVLGEVRSAEEFYSYSSKYTNKESSTIIPANIDAKLTKKVQDTALKVFRILDMHTYSRCDFFLTDDNKIVVNEINTIPGFTEISMYPKLFEASGISYKKLIDILINNSLDK